MFNVILFFFIERDGPRFVSKFVQAATIRKARKTAHRKSTLSSVTPDSISLDSSTVNIITNIPLYPRIKYILFNLQSAESKDPKMFHSTDNKFTRTTTVTASTDDVLKNRLSEDESNDSAFTDNGKLSENILNLFSYP